VGDSEAERGYLVGGPFDGTTFSLQNFWRYHGRGELAEPASRVVVSLDGEIDFMWSDSEFGVVLVPQPPVCVYGVDQDASGWRFTYTGEHELPVLGEQIS
jgi:hypothetical protein